MSTRYTFEGAGIVYEDAHGIVNNPGKLTVTIPDTVDVKAGPVADEPAASYVSDLAVMLQTQPHYTYVPGVGQVDRRTNLPVVAPASDAPWPIEPAGDDEWTQRRSLEQFQLASARTNQIYIDGNDAANKFGQPGTEPGVYYGNVSGRLRLRSDVPAPATPHFETPPMLTGEPKVQSLQWGELPAKSIVTQGLRGIDTAIVKFRYARKVRIGIVELQNPTFRYVSVMKDGKTIYDGGRGSPSQSLVTGEDFPAPDVGDEITLIVRNDGNENEPGDIIFNALAV